MPEYGGISRNMPEYHGTAPVALSFTGVAVTRTISFQSEHLRSIRNTDVDKPVARHFNAANHSISDIKVCAISPISGGNDSRKIHEKRLIFKIGTIHPHGLNEQFSFI